MPSPSTTLALPRYDLGQAQERFDLAMQKRGYIAQRVLPIFNTAVVADSYPVIPLDQLMAPAQGDGGKRASGAGYGRSSFTFTTASYACQEYGWEEPVDDRQARIYGGLFNAEMVATARCVEKILNYAEQRAVAALHVTTGMAGNAAANVAWSSYATAQPLTDFATARDAIWAATGEWPNAIVMSRKKFNDLRECAQIIDRIKNNANYPVLRGEINEAMMAVAFDVDQVIVSGTAKNSAKEGQTASIASTWTDGNVLVAKLATSSDLQEIALGRTFHYSADGSQPLGYVETYRDETIRADIVRVRHDVQEKIEYAKCAYLITSA